MLDLDAGPRQHDARVVANEPGERGDRGVDAQAGRRCDAGAVAELDAGAEAELEPVSEASARDGEQRAALRLAAADQPQRGLAAELGGAAELQPGVEREQTAGAVVEREP